MSVSFCRILDPTVSRDGGMGGGGGGAQISS